VNLAVPAVAGVVEGNGQGEEQARHTVFGHRPETLGVAAIVVHAGALFAARASGSPMAA
jgi:hypothetical protein